MQTVPSLVGTGTAIAAAASGLVFGQPSEDQALPRRTTIHEPRTSSSRFRPATSRVSSLPFPRSSAAPTPRLLDTEALEPRQPSSHRKSASRPPLSRYQRPSTSQAADAKIFGRRSSLARHDRGTFTAAPDAPRDSFSSATSWMKRLSGRPLSQQESNGSSSIYDAGSATLSHDSAAPILPSSSPVPLPPNKLVKRTPSIQDTTSRRRSKTHLPSLRRPATSHQRSATLQQLQIDFDHNPGYQPRYSFDRDLPQESSSLVTKPPETYPSQGNPLWTSFFHTRTWSLAGRHSPSKFGSDVSSQASPAYSKRLSIHRRPQHQVHLVKPIMVSEVSAVPLDSAAAISVQEAETGIGLAKEHVGEEAKESTPSSKRSKTPVSMTFPSSNDWVSRTSGSIHRPKRGIENRGSGERSVSNQFTGSHPSTEQMYHAEARARQPPAPGFISDGPAKEGQLHTSAHAKRTTSAPLPSFSRPFKIQEKPQNTAGGDRWMMNRANRQNQPSGSSSSSAGMPHFHNTTRLGLLGRERADTYGRDFTSGEEDETDYRSDRLFDSLRTAGSGPPGTIESRADSSFEDSPSAVSSSAQKKKRPSVQAMLSEAWQDGSTNMSAEEEDAALLHHRGGSGRGETAFPADVKFDMEEPPSKELADDQDGRFSLDDDFDEYWTADDDAPFSPLSPPSNSSSLNSRNMNPNVRLALSSSSNGHGLGESGQLETQSERPLSTLFDWSEPAYDRNEADGYSTRPKTAYAKPETDTRGGRSVTRKGPMPAHVRSQSVPVVHEGDEQKPSGSKYGTWATGTKPVSEDWGDDFDFAVEDDTRGDDSFFAVPDSIKASQPSVRAHSGQIREFSLLVNDLKRLCRHGRDMDMLGGPYLNLWKEAEGIIALASPDEDDSWAEDTLSSSSAASSLSSSHQDALGPGERACNELDRTSFDHDRHMSQTAVVKERSSPRRRSVFAPEDEIFGVSSLAEDASTTASRFSRPQTPENYPSKPQDVLGVVRSMIEVMDRRPAAPEGRGSKHSSDEGPKMQFDTNSLRALVKRASDLRDVLSDIIRKADQIMSSPVKTPRQERRLESSPAFTRVFDDPGSSPPKRGLGSHGNTTLLDNSSPERSPSSTIGRGIQAMAVN